MNHLDASEIIEFVSACTRDSASRENRARINLHILSCRECLNRVKAFSIIYGEGLTQTAPKKKSSSEKKEGLSLKGKTVGHS